MKYSTRVLALIVSQILSARLWAGPDWFHVPPVHSGSAEVLVDFTRESRTPEGDIWTKSPGSPITGPASHETKASEVWIHLRQPGLGTGHTVRGIILNYYESCSRGGCHPKEDQVEFELSFAEAGRYSGKLSRPIELSYQLNDGYALTRRRLLRQEIVFWIDGQIYKDSLTGSNLALDMLGAKQEAPGTPFVELTPTRTPQGTDYALKQPELESGTLLAGKRIAILTAHGVEKPEAEFPYEYLTARGATVEILVPWWSKSETGELGAVTSNYVKNVGFVKADGTFRSALEAKRPYDLILLTGGAWNAQVVSMDDEAKRLVREHFDAGKPIAAICKGTELLIQYDIAKQGVTLTGPDYARRNLVNAGATFLDQPVVTDCKTLLTSRGPSDLVEFVVAIKELLTNR